MPSPEAEAPRRDDPPESAESSSSASDAASTAKGSSGLGLARLSHHRLFTPAGMELYRHIARLVELGPEQEFLVVPCGTGSTARFLAETTRAAGAGVEPDAELAESATRKAREAGLSDRLHFEHAALDDLPYKDDVFDVVIGEPALSEAADPAAAVRELVRTAKPMGSVVLVQLIWTGNAGPARRDALIETLGVRPLLLVEWKQLLREAGVVDLYVEDWSDSADSPRQPWALGALGGFGTLHDRVALALRAWRVSGWRGLRNALAFRDEIRHLVLNERILGLSLIRGTKWRESDGTEA